MPGLGLDLPSAAGRRRGAPPPAVPDNAGLTRTVLLTGDSWVVDYGGYYAGWYKGARPELAIVNRAVGGRGLDGLVADEAAVIAQRPYIYHAGIGRNDLPLGTDEAAAAWVEALLAHLGRLKAALPGLRVSVETLCGQQVAGQAAANAGFNARRRVANTLIRQARDRGAIDAVVDFAADPVLGPDDAFTPGPAGPDRVSRDGLHLHDRADARTGHDIASAVFAAAMDALVAATPEPMEDHLSRFSIAAPAPRTEGDAGETVFAFPVTRVGAIAMPASVRWAVTGSGAAQANAADFGGTLPSGTLRFAAGEAAKSIDVAVRGDGGAEPDEGFTVTLSDPLVAGEIAAGAASSAVLNDDAQGAGVGFAAPTPPAALHVGFGSTAATFPGVALAAGEALFHTWSFGADRQPATLSLVPAGGGPAIAGEPVARDGDLSLWRASVAQAGSYDLTFGGPAQPFYLIGTLPFTATGAAWPPTAMQALPGAYRNSPVAMAAEQAVPANGLGFVLTALTHDAAAVTARPDGAVERAALRIVDPGGISPRVTLAMATLAAGAVPQVAFQPGTAAIGMTALSFDA